MRAPTVQPDERLLVRRDEARVLDVRLDAEMLAVGPVGLAGQEHGHQDLNREIMKAFWFRVACSGLAGQERLHQDLKRQGNM